ncbi:Uncharacterised protein [Mycobacterium tuberculosis]|nr:Uncharacterised protein [Mycobacterium tuberculosis]
MAGTTAMPLLFCMKCQATGSFATKQVPSSAQEVTSSVPPWAATISAHI